MIDLSGHAGQPAVKHLSRQGFDLDPHGHADPGDCGKPFRDGRAQLERIYDHHLEQL